MSRFRVYDELLVFATMESGPKFEGPTDSAAKDEPVVSSSRYASPMSPYAWRELVLFSGV